MISELATESSINSTINGSFRGSLVKIPSNFKNTLSTRSQGYRFPQTVSGEKDRQCPVVPLTHLSLKFIWRLKWNLNKASAEKDNRRKWCVSFWINVLSRVHLKNGKVFPPLVMSEHLASNKSSALNNKIAHFKLHLLPHPQFFFLT